MENGMAIVKHQIRLTAELAYTLGWVLGDGYVNKREMDAIVSERERSFIEPFVKPVLGGFGSVFVVPRNGALIIRCNSTVLSRTLCSPKGTRIWPNVDFILDSSRYARCLIAGFWDADGGIYREVNGTVRAHLYNSNLFLLDRVARAMEVLYGIEVSIYKRKANDERPESKIHAHKDRFDLYVLARSNNLWKKYIARFMLIPWKKPHTS
jgi:hypothetical protein